MKPSLFLCCLSLSVICTHSQATQGTGYQAATDFCCNTQPAPNVQVTPNNIQDVINDSPNYEIISTPSILSVQDIDNICHTYFEMGNEVYFRISTLTFANGTFTVQKYIMGAVPGYPGVGRIQGLTLESGSSTLVFDEANLGNPCPGVRVYYRKYIAGSCNVLQDNIKDGTDLRHGDANTRGMSDYCLSQVVSIANSQDFSCDQFVVYPYNLNSNCVTQFNGISCVNADKVRPQDSITLPYSGSNCQTLFY